MKIAGGQIVVNALKEQGISELFGLIGYYVSPIFAACAKENIKVYDVRHEQAAVHMADGYAESSGKIGVAVVTGGPGFANCVSAIIKAQKASTPILVITGGFEPHRKDNGGLEDMDQLALVKPFTKWCATVYDTKRISEYIATAVRYATNGKRGPVVLEIPINYLLNEVEESELTNSSHLKADARIYGDDLKEEEAVSLIMNAKKPVLIAGSGVFYSNAGEALKSFAEYSNIPVYTVNLGRGVLPDDHEICMGTGRTIEGGPQIYAYRNADLVIVVGSTLDYSVSFGREPVFSKEQKFIQIDIDPCEIGFSGRGIDVGIVGHSDIVLKQLLVKLEEKKDFCQCKFVQWLTELKKNKEQYYQKLYQENQQDSEGISPVKTIETINRVIPKDSIVVTDGSNAMLWGCLLFQSYEAAHYIVGPNANYGQMGTGLPTAIGCKLANKDKTVILYTGDGSFGFNLIEINTAIRFGIKIIIVIHNDSAWGFCKETQRCIFGKENSGFGTELGFTRYDELVKAFGGYGELVKDSEELEPAIKRALQADTISCINVVTDGKMSPGSEFINGTVK